jgi:hypothetical protein
MSSRGNQWLSGFPILLRKQICAALYDHRERCAVSEYGNAGTRGRHFLRTSFVRSAKTCELNFAVLSDRIEDKEY